MLFLPFPPLQNRPQQTLKSSAPILLPWVSVWWFCEQGTLAWKKNSSIPILKMIDKHLSKSKTLAVEIAQDLKHLTSLRTPV